MDTASEIFLVRKNKIIIPNLLSRPQSPNSSLPAVLAMNKNMENFGFTFDVEAIDALSNIGIDDLSKLWDFLKWELGKKVGANRLYRVLYPNFPRQVMEADFCELYVNALVHYLSSGTLVPDYKSDPRFPRFESQKKAQIISIGTYSELVGVISMIISSNTSISELDKSHLQSLAREDLELFLDALQATDDIPNKEILSFVAGLVLEYSVPVDISKNFKTATDVLRLAVSLSGGDVSLAKPTKFKSFNRKTRRFLLNILENCSTDIVEDMARHPKMWIRLGERLHPFEYKSMTKVNLAFDIIRNSKVKTFNGLLDECALMGTFEEYIELVSKMPGEFARRLDYLLRNNPVNSWYTLSAFSEVMDDVSTPVLLQLLGHFSTRNQRSLRTFVPKGNFSKAMVIENNLPEIFEPVVKSLLLDIEETLVGRFANMEPLGKVYVDPRLSHYLIPSSQRSASSSTRSVVRGSRLPIESNAKTIRAFIHWKNLLNESAYDGEDRVDIDLSSAIYDSDWNKVDDVWYGNLRTSNGELGCHSGDIVSAPLPNGASEFLDINIEPVKKLGGRYVVFAVNNFTHQNFSETRPLFGWMTREYSDSGEIFEPSMVENLIEMSNPNSMAVSVIFDVEEMSMIWVDMPLSIDSYNASNIVSNSKSTKTVAQGIVEIYKSKISLQSLFFLHVVARGEFVDNPEDADTVFGLDFGDVSAFDLEKVASEYMS